MRASSLCAFTACATSLILPTAHDVSTPRSDMVTAARPQKSEQCSSHPIEGRRWRWEEVQCGSARPHAGWQRLDAHVSNDTGSGLSWSATVGVPLRLKSNWLDQGKLEQMVKVWSLFTTVLSAIQASLSLLLSLGLLVLGLFWLTYAITDETTDARTLLLTIGLKSVLLSSRFITWTIDHKTVTTQVARYCMDTPLTASCAWCVTYTKQCEDGLYLSAGVQHWSWYILCVQLTLLATAVVAYAVAPCYEKEGWAPVLAIAVMLTAVCCCFEA